MKSFLYITIIVFVILFSNNLKAYDTVRYNLQTTSDTTINLSNINIYGLRIYGNGITEHTNSLVRVLLFGQNDEIILVNEFLFPIDSIGLHYFSYTEEGVLIDNLVADKLNIYVKNSSVRLDSIIFYADRTERSMSDTICYDAIVSHKIERLNLNLEKNGYIWRANVPYYSYYFINRNYLYYGANTYGFDFYGNGIFSPTTPNKPTKTTSIYVNFWDWRYRHGAMDETSFYWDGNPDSFWHIPSSSVHQERNGWMTKIHCQFGNNGAPWDRCTSGCFLFAPTTTVACNLNLYYNQHLDIDLSEQFSMDCSSYVTRTCYNGGHTNEVLDAFLYDGVVDEACYPYINDTSDCTYSFPETNKIYISDYNACGSTYSVCSDEDLKEKLITKGPMSANLGGHSMCLVGFGLVYPNMILDTDNSYGNITILESRALPPIVL